MSIASHSSLPYKQKALVELWPSPQRSVNLVESLEEIGDCEQAKSLLASYESLQGGKELSACPIIGVLGQLNAGKSSVVASFLSSSSRALLPRGTSGKLGTHRFVYWVPQSWLEQTAKRALLLEYLQIAHGEGIEWLSQNPEESHEQYRSGRHDFKKLNIPLVAGDQALNAMGCAFLDCPDIQTYHAQEVGEENQRLAFLGQASRVCSAFYLVWMQSGIRDILLRKVIETVRSRMAHIPLNLLVNFVRGEEIFEDEDMLCLCSDYHIEKHQLFEALDFDVRDWEGLLPQAFREDALRAAAGSFPFFFTYKETQACSMAESFCTLNLAEIQAIKRADHQREWEKNLELSWQKIEIWNTLHTREVMQWREGIIGLCTARMRNPQTGEPLQIVSKEFANSLQEAFLLTAPAALQWSLRLANPFEKAFEQARGVVKAIASPKIFARDSLHAVKEKVESALQVEGLDFSSSQQVAAEMLGQRWCPVDTPIEALEKTWAQIFKDFNRHLIEHFEVESFEGIARDYWKQMPLRKKIRLGGRALLGAFGSLAALGGIMTIAIDGGATFFAATSLASALSTGVASLVAGAGSLAVIASFRQKLLEVNTLPYLARLCSIALSRFGIPFQVGGLSGFELPRVDFSRQKGESLESHYLECPEGLPPFPCIFSLGKKELYTFVKKEEPTNH